ncbi:RecQ family ATP-dependent DNA helicase [Metabacillus iocasae]|uniref:ATP-dependent DNA helicase RecQ n=1 Tax=Priestia iocasae TaxID=2291674 RepID=A0ABS2QT39_9BACI|nr:RecQ family ATP-dependent DNA helicase [Metabacillus iocasae]MBM7701689.1 ATP-dependent DNA helicase RecQ [Metabacillus iocasae]
MNIDKVLQSVFGFQEFRTGQREIIEDILHKKHVLAVLPTGTGKSLCYQLPGYIINQPVLIISPLLSLMEDQVQQLKANGEKRVVALNSFLSEGEKRRALEKIESYRFIYASPEILQNGKVVQALKRANIGLFVVDEAHCISQWGHDFRLDYLRLGDVWEQVGQPTALALTATATKEVIADIIHYLNLNHVTKHIYSVDRPNIAISVKRVTEIEEKKQSVLEYVRTFEGPGIIYCSSRSWAESLSLFLKTNHHARVEYYHGGMEQSQRLLVQQQFINNQLDIICCTSAFGMGVNKENIRFVIHFHPSSQLEAYLQEIGRAGRDGKDSIAVLLYHESDDGLASSLMEMELPSPGVIRHVLLTIKGYENVHDIKSFEHHIRNMMGIDETHWRFIRYYLQKEQILTDEGFNRHFDVEMMMKEIVQATNERFRDKSKKYEALKQFVSATSCRRERLLAYFDDELVDRPTNCCDCCGIEFEDYHSKNNDSLKKWVFHDWEKELALILRQSE